MNITVPELSLVVLIGASGGGKSTFARRHFLPTEVISSDTCRGLVADDENDQSATPDAFDTLHYIAGKRLKGGRLAVVDATNVRAEDRKPLVQLARDYHCLPVAIVFDLPERVCRERNAERPDRDFGPHVIRNQIGSLHRSLRGLEREGFRYVYMLRSTADVEAVTIERQPLWNNKKTETGPFDIIGDVHGCFDELCRLLGRLGYQLDRGGERWRLSHPHGRKVVFVGDLVDRGPGTPDVLRLAMAAIHSGDGYCVIGNHDLKLYKALRGKQVKISHGLAESLEQLGRESDDFRAEAMKFLDGLVSHYVFDGGRLVVAHAGLRAEMQGRGSGKVREFAMYGETTGETDEYGLPVRYNWAADYRGTALVAYGHTPVLNAEWFNNTICLDTGCVFGGRLTALRYPERELVAEPALRMYYEPLRPLEPATSGSLSMQQEADDLLDLADCSGKRILHPRLGHSVTIRPENAAAALEVMSRFAANPKWLVYLPPTMSPAETSEREGFLEHPAEALDYYRRAGIGAVVCQEKHMGSRAVVVIAKDEAAAQARFGIANEGQGIVYTRTGRRFFTDGEMERHLLGRLAGALSAAGFWEAFNSDWFVLDCELMPWSLKARELLIRQYAAVGAASGAMLAQTHQLLEMAGGRGIDIGELSAGYAERWRDAQRFTDAYRRYCWPVTSIDDVRLAPFHLLASEGGVHINQTHVWHMEQLHRLAAADASLLLATHYRVADLADEAACESVIDWWLDLTEKGGEGMVVKPLDFVSGEGQSRIQPAVKCRGREYLRIIYGPEYTEARHLSRLRRRSLGGKRALAWREFTLGLEALERFIARKPLRQVHECVFGVLALESEPVDPRL
ncbi:MAG: polynucleotide kinase-phosphatase [Candidatus Competibacteraceae bacterium]|nr:polynucleotide kinase-phosphatase [Candidatus Competibacteraceae bacterium]